MSGPRDQKLSWPSIPGVDQHLARTGERPPARWCERPADMVHHGGYAAANETEVRGPFCWHANAEREAGTMEGGRVVRWRSVEHREEVVTV